MKDDLWLACKRKTCCSATIVVPSGRDVWRISRALDAPPWAFTRYFPGPPERPDAFRLAPGGPTFRLVLAKQPSRRTKTLPPCVFLMRTPDGHHRCGLGPLRPLVCQCHPAELIDGVLAVRTKNACTCREWSLADLDVAREAERVTVRQAEAAEYHRVVAAWNARIAAAPPDATFDFPAYGDYLLAAYDALAASSNPSRPDGCPPLAPKEGWGEDAPPVLSAPKDPLAPSLLERESAARP